MGEVYIIYETLAIFGDILAYAMKHKTVYINNKKVFFNYEVQRSIEAGIELLGYEVKSIKAGNGSLEGSYVIVRGGEAYLLNARISPYQSGNTPKEYEPLRTRKLILHKAEIAELAESEGKKGKASAGLAVVPIALYNNAGKIKVELGIAKGKKKFDKRESIKKRETEREIRRDLKR
jgi:SsrA-binding protein